MHLNAEFQRTARRDKTDFLSEQCKHTEENNKMVKSSNLFKKIGATKGTFHAKIRTIKDRNSKDLTEEIKKRWQEYIEELYIKAPNDPDNHDSVITHLEPDILECEVKWALGSITTKKTSGGDGIPVKLFQSLKDDAKVYFMPVNLEISAVATEVEKGSFHSNPKGRHCWKKYQQPQICR